MIAPVPRYGSASLADLPGSVLAALGVPGEANVLDLPEVPRACVLLVDGLGWELLQQHAGHAPFLSQLASRQLTAGFPATTATSLASLGTGRPPGGHGLFGYQMALPGTGRLLNCLRWDEQTDPRTVQPGSTVYERAAAAGVHAAYVGPRAFRASGLTRAVARGADYAAAEGLGWLVAATEAELTASPRSYVFTYFSDLDTVGHLTGAGSLAWRYQLGFVDALAERIASALPAGSALYVTADHGMTNPTERLDVDATPGMREGVALLGGEARARHVYARPGAQDDVLAVWREVLGDRAWVRTRAEAVAAGWFGPVAPELAGRIGDVVAVPNGSLAIVATETEPAETTLIGMHGSMVPGEQLIPLLRHVA